MRTILSILFALITLASFAQEDEYELYQKAEKELDNYNYIKAIEIYDKLINLKGALNLESYYYDRARAKYYLKDYDGAMLDINEHFKRRDNFCSALYLRGELKIKFKDREGACKDWQKANSLCKNDYKQIIEEQCDNSWDYNKIIKAYFLDTTYVDYYIGTYSVGCKEKIADTIFKFKTTINEKGNDTEMFYDRALKNIREYSYTHNDTLYTISYYPNGKKKKETRSVDNVWIYDANWCENGQLTSCYNPNELDYHTETTFYCNGNIEWQGNIARFSSWGISSRWHENGQKKSEKLYTEYNKELVDRGQLESKLISEKYWDENGKEIVKSLR